MPIIKRTKAAPPGPGETTPRPPAVHYATSVAPLGNVTGWTAERDKAGEFDFGTAGRVLAFYTSISSGGIVEIEGARSVPGNDPRPEPAPEVIPEKPQPKRAGRRVPPKPEG